jgi:hypothetical protein
MTDRIPGVRAALSPASGGPAAGAKGLLDVLAGDLAAAGRAARTAAVGKRDPEFAAKEGEHSCTKPAG